MHLTLQNNKNSYENVHSSVGDILTPQGYLLSLAEQLLYFNTRIAPCQYLNYSSVEAATVPTLLGLILIPGPIVEATATDLMY